MSGDLVDTKSILIGPDQPTFADEMATHIAVDHLGVIVRGHRLFRMLVQQGAYQVTVSLPNYYGLSTPKLLAMVLCAEDYRHTQQIYDNELLRFKREAERLAKEAEESEKARQRALDAAAQLEAARIEEETRIASLATWHATQEEWLRNHTPPGPERRAQVFALRQKGETLRSIGQTMGISGTTVSLDLQKHERDIARRIKRLHLLRSRPIDMGGPRERWLEWTPQMQAQEFGLAP